MHDVIIVGGGPAGLSAALVLGRCRRRVCLFDAGEPRNRASRAMHGFITRDGIAPAEFQQIARTELRTYPNIELYEGEVTSAKRGDRCFTVGLNDGRKFTARILLLATGIVDELPRLNGFEQFWGRTIHLCPYCDGWEHRDQPIAVYGRGIEGVDLAIEMLGWSDDLFFCTDGPAGLDAKQVARLDGSKIALLETRIERLEGEGDHLSGVRFVDGTVRPCAALFFSAPQKQCSSIGKELGCKFSEDGTTLDCKECASTNVPGLYVAGNTSRGLQLVIMAAAEGTQAAFTINQALLEADLDL